MSGGAWTVRAYTMRAVRSRLLVAGVHAGYELLHFGYFLVAGQFDVLFFPWEGDEVCRLVDASLLEVGH